MGPVELEGLEALEALQELEALEEAVDRLARCDLANYADSDSIERLERVRSRLGAIVTGAVAEFDASGAWAPSGARTAAAWLRRHCRLPSNEASREVRRGRQCRELPHFEAAWSAGEIGAACVDLVASVRRPATEAALARDEEMLVDYAKTLAFAEFVGVLRYWEQHADPDGAEDDAMERRARRDVYLVPSVGGTFLGKMTLDPITGAIVSGELGRLERELFESDWAKAQDELGRDPTVDELGRTSAQRRADALVEMATRSGTAPADGRRPAPLFGVLVDYPTLAGRVRPGPAGRGRYHLSLLHRGHPPGHRAAGPRVPAPLLRRTGRALSGRSHRRVLQRWPDISGERSAPVRLPQPPAQPAAAAGRRGLTNRRAFRPTLYGVIRKLQSHSKR
jgi:hypothetical protein